MPVSARGPRRNNRTDSRRSSAGPRANAHGSVRLCSAGRLSTPNRWDNAALFENENPTPPSPEILDQHDVALEILRLAVENRPAVWGHAQAINRQQPPPFDGKDVLDGAGGKAKELKRKAGLR